MVDLGDLASQISAIDSALSKAGYSAESMRDALGELSKLKYTTSDPEDLKTIEQKVRALKTLQKQATDTYETERKGLEMVVGQNKQLLELLDKTILKHEGLAKAVGRTAGAYVTLRDKGDLGQAISQMSFLLGRFQALGVIVGTVISVATKFQDRIQMINKTVIDATASVGRFSEGMAMAESQTLALSTGLASYGMNIGETTEALEKHIGALGQLGFSFEEMGVDRATGEITTLTDAIEGQVDSWGALSTSIGVARATGLDTQAVMQTMGMQVKTLGDSVEDVAESFAALSVAADKSGLSTRTLLPLVRGMQDQFKFLGFDSTAAAQALAAAGEAAEAAGVTAGQATDVMARAIGGIAQMDFGQMTFFGQQLGMGGGLTAGMRFREQAGGAGGADLAQQIGRVVGNIMGGTGELITIEQAKTNETLASLRLAQEKFAAKSLGLSQHEARVFIQMAAELEEMRALGQDTTQKEEELNKRMKEMQMSEGEYRRRTLKLSEKIAQLLELISMTVGRLLLTFIRAFMGGAAEEADGGLTGVFKKAMEGISKGEGFDKTFGKEGLTGAMEGAFEDIDPVVEKWGRRMGKLFDTLFGGWTNTLLTVFGGTYLISTFRRGFTGMLEKGLSGMGGGIVRRLFGRGGGVAAGAGDASRRMIEGMSEAGGQATRAATATQPGRIARMLSSAGQRFSNVMGTVTRRLPTFSRALGGPMRLLGRLGGAIGRAIPMLIGNAGLAAAVGAAGYALGSWIANLEIGEKTVSEHLGDLAASLVMGTEAVEEAAAAHNKIALASKEAADALEKQTGVTTETARAIFEQEGAAGVAEKFGEDTGGKLLQQTAAKLAGVIKMQEREIEASTEAAEDAKDWFSVDTEALEQAETRITGARITIAESMHQLEEIAKKLDVPVEQLLAKATPKEGAKKDAWDISKAGFIYASPGDVVVSADSMGQAGSSGPEGAAAGKAVGAGAIERDIILNVQFMHDVIGKIAEEQVMISIEKDIVAAGKTGQSGLRHGKNKGYG